MGGEGGEGGELQPDPIHPISNPSLSHICCIHPLSRPRRGVSVQLASFHYRPLFFFVVVVLQHAVKARYESIQEVGRRQNEEEADGE